MEWDWRSYGIQGGQRAGEIQIPGEEICAFEMEKIPVQPLVQDKKPDDPMGWRQYRWEKEEKEVRRLNAASISVYARSLMAREWARALGKR